MLITGYGVPAIENTCAITTGHIVQLDDKPRSVEQNALLFALLTDISKQVKWPVNGKLEYLDRYSWKTIFSAELRKEQRIAAGISGGFVLLGLSTRTLKVREFSDLLAIIYVFATEHNVTISDPTCQEDAWK